MIDFKALSKKFLHPPLWVMILLAILSAVGLTLVFIKGWENLWIAYIIYVVAFYTLSVLTLFFIFTLPKYYRSTKQRIYDTKLGNRYMTDLDFKVRISLYISLAINCIFAAVKFASSIYYSSQWWGAIAFYYITLSVIRFLLLRYMRKPESTKDLISDFRRYRLCGIFLIFVYLTFSAILFMIVRQNMTYVYSEILTITLAAYTFYTVTMSIIDLIRYRKHRSPVLSAAKALRFVSALVSLLSLETAMLTTFDSGFGETNRDLMIILTGAGISVIILSMSVYMILRANREIRKLRQDIPTSPKSQEYSK